MPTIEVVRHLRTTFYMHNFHIIKVANAKGINMKKRIENKKSKNDFNPIHTVAAAGAAGLTLLIFIAIGFWLGELCDDYFATKPFGVMIGSVLGAVMGLLSLIKQMLEKK